MTKRYISLILLLLGACKKEVIPDPDPVLLLSPTNNDTCNTAIVLDNQQSQVNFRWQEALNTTEYELVVRDLMTNVDLKKQTMRLFSSAVLERGKQYSWWVISKSDQTENVSKSNVWTFYLEGIQTSSHFPFPARFISPENNTQVGLNNGRITLRWEGIDIDNDIESYAVFLGTDSDSLELMAENLSNGSFQVSLNGGETYYWRVITKDGEGNTSESPIGQFRTTP